MKMETIRSLQDCIDSLKKQSSLENEKSAREIGQFKETIKRKEDANRVLSD
jgi:hypothetical protein